MKKRYPKDQEVPRSPSPAGRMFDMGEGDYVTQAGSDAEIDASEMDSDVSDTASETSITLAETIDALTDEASGLSEGEILLLPDGISSEEAAQIAAAVPPHAAIQIDMVDATRKSQTTLAMRHAAGALPKDAHLIIGGHLLSRSSVVSAALALSTGRVLQISSSLPLARALGLTRAAAGILGPGRRFYLPARDGLSAQQISEVVSTLGHGVICMLDFAHLSVECVQAAAQALPALTHLSIRCNQAALQEKLIAAVGAIQNPSAVLIEADTSTQVASAVAGAIPQNVSVVCWLGSRLAIDAALAATTALRPQTGLALDDNMSGEKAILIAQSLPSEVCLSLPAGMHEDVMCSAIQAMPRDTLLRIPFAPVARAQRAAACVPQNVKLVVSSLLPPDTIIAVASALSAGAILQFVEMTQGHAWDTMLHAIATLKAGSGLFLSNTLVARLRAPDPEAAVQQLAQHLPAGTVLHLPKEIDIALAKRLFTVLHHVAIRFHPETTEAVKSAIMQPNDSTRAPFAMFPLNPAPSSGSREAGEERRRTHDGQGDHPPGKRRK